jgi:hypothetical protein
MEREEMKYFLFTVILVGCFGFVFSLLTSAIGVSLVFLAPLVVAIIIWVKNYQNIFRKKIRSNILLFSVFIIFFYGCTVKVPMTPDCRGIEYKEKLPIEAGLLITEKTRQYVFRGKPESFTAGARPHEFPLGETLELASEIIFSELFKDVSLIRSLEEGRHFKLIIKPQIDDFHFRYDQLSHAGFAVSCLSRIKVTITLFSEDTKIWEKTIESPDVKRGPWMVNIDYERDIGESASEALVYTLNQIALEISDNESLKAHILDQKTLAAYQPQEKQELASKPETALTTQATHQPQETPKLASLPKEAPVVRVLLRRQPKAILNQMGIRRILVQYNFFEISMNTHGSFANDLVDNNDETLTDNATGLMWQKGGSLELLDNRRAKEYIKQLNSQRFAGYSDWRMPTIEELMSLLNSHKNNGVYIAPAFANQQTTCWSADQTEYRSGAWIISFSRGEVRQARWRSSQAGGSLAPGSLGSVHKNTTNYIKAVRSVR